MTMRQGPERVRGLAVGPPASGAADRFRLAWWPLAAVFAAGGAVLFFALDSAETLGAPGAATAAAAALAAIYAAVAMLAPRRQPTAIVTAVAAPAREPEAPPTHEVPSPRPEGAPRDLPPGGAASEGVGKPPAGGLLGRLHDQAPLGIAVLDDEGRVVESNATFRSIAGLADGAGADVRLADIVIEADRADLASRCDAARASAARTAPLKVGIAARDRTLAQLYLAPIAEAAAGPGLIAYLVDTTEHRTLEEQFVQSQKMQAVGQLAGGIAHDLNNLLTAMIGFCDLLLLRHAPGDQSFADIMQIKQNANRAANLVRQLLAFSRRQTLQPKTLNLTDVLAELSHLLRRLIGENITLKFVHDRDLGLVKVDQGQLEQVIINLVVNARDAMPEGGTLTIRTDNVTFAEPSPVGHEQAPAGDYVRVEVRDTGSGIDPEHIGKIFEPFFSTKDAGSGTGLGLSTVYGIIKQTEGFIVPESAPGEGTLFSIYLPRFAESAEAGAAEESGVNEARDLTGSGTILLVEDEGPVRVFAARALTAKGYTVVEADCGEAALELLASAIPNVDLLITDVVMPAMDGPTLLRRARESRPGMKAILISGYAEDVFRGSLESADDVRFLPKPFSLKELAGTVKTVMAEAPRG